MADVRKVVLCADLGAGSRRVGAITERGSRRSERDGDSRG